MHTPRTHQPVFNRTSVRGLLAMCELRACLLGAGVVVGVIVDVTDGPSRIDGRLALAAAALFLVSTSATLHPRFPRASTRAMVSIGMLDIVTLMFVFLLPRGTTVVESFIAVPAVWLGVVLGRRGIAVVGLTCAVLYPTPSLLLHGQSGLGWHLGISIVVFALIASSAVVASTEMWADYATRLETTAEELRCALEVKDEFVSLVSHELRTPLTSIIGYLDLVMDEVAGLPLPARAHLAAVSRNADRLLVLVTDLLAAERAEREPMHLFAQPTDVSLLAQLSLNDLAFRAESAHVSITADIEPDITISADPTRFLQVVDNLMSNAVKYTPPTGAVALVLRREDDHVVLEVTDTGIGIHADDVPGLFAKFFRARNATALAIPGIGLGLMITRMIVEAHGGTIEARSEEGIGTSITVCLPGGPSMPDVTSHDPALVGT